MISQKTIELVSIIIIILITVGLTISIHINKRKAWANEPLVGMSWICMVIGTIIIIIAYIVQNV